jgi:hypothetical protein
MKRMIAFLMIVSVMGAMLAGCGEKKAEEGAAAGTTGTAAPAEEKK